MFKKLNLFFFGEETIALSDFLYFYGILIAISFIVLTSVIPAQLQLL